MKGGEGKVSACDPPTPCTPRSFSSLPANVQGLLSCWEGEDFLSFPFCFGSLSFQVFSGALRHSKVGGTGSIRGPRKVPAPLLSPLIFVMPSVPTDRKGEESLSTNLIQGNGGDEGPPLSPPGGKRTQGEEEEGPGAMTVVAVVAQSSRSLEMRVTRVRKARAVPATRRKRTPLRPGRGSWHTSTSKWDRGSGPPAPPCRQASRNGCG